MAQKFQGRFSQEGTKIEHTPSGNVSAGDVVVQNALVGVAREDIAASALGTLQVAGIVDIVKVTGSISAGVAVYWDATGNPLGGVAGTGALTSSSGGNSFVGFVVEDAPNEAEFAIVYMVPAISVTPAALMTATITDPGPSGAIPAGGSGSVALVSVGAETRTLAAPTLIGSMLNIYMKTDGGNIILTVATTIKEDGSNTITFTDEGEFIALLAVEEGSTLRWREMGNDGAAVTTV